MRINRVAAFAVAAAIAATISSAPAYAGTQTASFTVSADVAANCTISATNLDFTSYDPTSATDKDATSMVSVLCTNSSAWNIGLSAGGFSGATVTTRKMTGPSTYSLGYSLFSDSSRSVNWGNVGTERVSGTGAGANQDNTVYGRIPSGQNVGAGHYSDSITATVTF